jgi:hypothetical protein
MTLELPMADLLFKLFDLLLGGLITKWREKRAIVAEFETLRRHVVYETIMNNIPVKLNHLRSFLIAKGLVERPGIREFYSKWLTNPIVVMGVAAVNVYSREALEELRGDLSGLQL